MPGRPERVTFTRKSAQRVAKMVRDAERGQRDMPPVKFRQASPGGAEVRFGFINANWNKGNTATVTQVDPSNNETILPLRTFTAVNYFATVNVTVTVPFPRVACVSVGTTWLLIAAECV